MTQTKKDLTMISSALTLISFKEQIRYSIKCSTGETIPTDSSEKPLGQVLITFWKTDEDNNMKQERANFVTSAITSPDSTLGYIGRASSVESIDETSALKAFDGKGKILTVTWYDKENGNILAVQSYGMAKQGESGDSYEFIYKLTDVNVAPSVPDTTSQTDGYVPSGWTGAPTGVSMEYPYEWVCFRHRTSGVWGRFTGSASDKTKAALWASYQKGMNANLLLQTRFENMAEMDKWEYTDGDITESGYAGYNAFVGTGNVQASYKDILRQVIYRSATDKIVEPGKWYTLSFYAKQTGGGISIPVNVTSTAYGFAFKDVYLKAGNTVTLTVRGYCNAQAQTEKRYLRVYLFKQTDSGSWLENTFADIKTTSSSSASMILNAKTGGVYKIQAYVYPNTSSGSSTTASATVESYTLDRGGEIMTFIYPALTDKTAGGYVDGSPVSMTSDGNVTWKLTTEWLRHTYTFKTKTSLSGVQNVLWRLTEGSNDAFICMPKLEEGKTATAYVPHDSDNRQPVYTLALSTGDTVMCTPNAKLKTQTLTVSLRKDDTQVPMYKPKVSVLDDKGQVIYSYSNTGDSAVTSQDIVTAFNTAVNRGVAPQSIQVTAQISQSATLVVSGTFSVSYEAPTPFLRKETVWARSLKFNNGDIILIGGKVDAGSVFRWAYPISGNSSVSPATDIQNNPGTTKWVALDYFNMIATNLLLAEGANIGAWYISKGKIVSTLDSTQKNKIELDAAGKVIRVTSSSSGGDFSFNRNRGSSLTIDAEDGTVTVSAADNSSKASYMSPSGIFANGVETMTVPSTSVGNQCASMVAVGEGDSDDDIYSRGTDDNAVIGVYGNAGNSGTAPSYGGMFVNLRVHGFMPGITYINTTATSFNLTDTATVVMCSSTGRCLTYLPASMRDGQVVLLEQIGTGSMRIYASGGQKLRTGATAASYFDVSTGQTVIAIFEKGFGTEAWCLNRIKY